MSERDTGQKERGSERDHAAEEKLKKETKTGLEAYALISQTGLMIVIPIVLGAAAGHWLDEKLGTGIVFFLILLFAGIASGFYGAYTQINITGKWKK